MLLGLRRLDKATGRCTFARSLSWLTVACTRGMPPSHGIRQRSVGESGATRLVARAAEADCPTPRWTIALRVRRTSVRGRVVVTPLAPNRRVTCAASLRHRALHPCAIAATAVRHRCYSRAAVMQPPSDIRTASKRPPCNICATSVLRLCDSRFCSCATVARQPRHGFATVAPRPHDSRATAGADATLGVDRCPPPALVPANVDRRHRFRRVRRYGPGSTPTWLRFGQFGVRRRSVAIPCDDTEQRESRG